MKGPGTWYSRVKAKQCKRGGIAPLVLQWSVQQELRSEGRVFIQPAWNLCRSQAFEANSAELLTMMRGFWQLDSHTHHNH